MPADGFGNCSGNFSKNSRLVKGHRWSVGEIFENRFIDAFQGLICEEEKQVITVG